MFQIIFCCSFFIIDGNHTYINVLMVSINNTWLLKPIFYLLLQFFTGIYSNININKFSTQLIGWTFGVYELFPSSQKSWVAFYFGLSQLGHIISLQKIAHLPSTYFRAPICARNLPSIFRELSDSAHNVEEIMNKPSTMPVLGKKPSTMTVLGNIPSTNWLCSEIFPSTCKVLGIRILFLEQIWI